MAPDDRLIRNVSDTARWVAAFRAHETERPDALFRDPLARRLAGERGEEISRTVSLGAMGEWPMVARTLLFDAFVTSEVARGADMVVNLAAGLDTRPYRMNLPASLRWVEVDLPEILEYKEGVLAGEKPVCALERVRCDLANVDARRALFSRLAGSSHRVLVITEGLLIYLSPEEVAALARDLAAAGPAFQRWVTDLASPGLLKRMTARTAKHLEAAPFKFAPAEGPAFFGAAGWRVLEARSFFREAARVGRLPWWMIPFSWFPEPTGAPGNRPWAAVVLLERS